MKHKHFYSHLVERTSITLEIAELSVSSEERIELISLADANIHTHVVHNVLNELSPQDKKIFLQNISRGDHKKTWEHLLAKIDDAEEKIHNTVQKAVADLLIDIEKSKKLNKKSKPS